MTMLLITSVTTAQTLSEKVGIPSDFAALENTILTGKTVTSLELTLTFTMKRVNRKMVVDTAWSYQLVTAPGTAVTGYGLNFVHNYLYEFNLEHRGGMTLARDGVSKTVTVGPFSGQTYYYGYEQLEFYSVPSGYEATHSAYPFSNAERNGYPAKKPWQTYRVNYVNKLSSTKTTTSRGFIDLTAERLYAKTGITEQWLHQNTYGVYHFRSVDPNVYVTSIFGLIDKTGDVYTNATLINGKYYKSFNYQSLKTPWGNPLGELSFSWVVYNGCEVPAVKPTDGNSTGNFGECFRRMYSSFQPQSQSITITSGSSFSSNAQGNIVYDSSKPVIVQLVIHRHPMPEKNTEQEGYFNPATGERVYKLF